MKTKILGILIIATGVLFIGHSQYGTTSGGTTQIIGAGTVLSSPSGRYVFGATDANNPLAATYMLDVQSGRLWRLTLTESNGLFLNPIVYQLITGKTALAPLDTDKELNLLQQQMAIQAMTNSSTH